MRAIPALVLALSLGSLLAAPTAAAIEREVIVYLHENPLHALPEQINAEVGDVLTLRVENTPAEGKTPHNLLLCGDGKKPSESCDDRWGFTPMIEPGGVATITVTLAKAGVFEYYCYIPGHKTGGMVGELHVAGPAEGKSGIPAAGLAAALAVLALAALAFGRRR